LFISRSSRLLIHSVKKVLFVGFVMIRCDECEVCLPATPLLIGRVLFQTVYVNIEIARISLRGLYFGVYVDSHGSIST